MSKNGAGAITLPDFILQSYHQQNSMVLAQKQTQRSMEQNRKPRNKPIHLWSIKFQQRNQDYKDRREKIVCSSGYRKTGQQLVKE